MKSVHERDNAARKLIEKFGYWSHHGVHTVEDWQYEVANGDTKEGYWPWVVGRIEQAEDDRK